MDALEIILAAKWLVRHSITSPKQQRRPLSSNVCCSHSEREIKSLADNRKKVEIFRGAVHLEKATLRNEILE